jgi:subtilisin family serine protease
VRQRYLAAIGAPAAWTIFLHPKTGIKSNVVVGVPDVGFAVTHEDLVADEPNGWPGTFIDGKDFVNGTNDLTPVPQTQEACQEESDHGTMIAGIIGARSGNRKGITSVTAGTARVLPMKILGTCGPGVNELRPTDFRNAVSYAAVRGAQVLSLSVFPSRDTELEDAFVNNNLGVIQGAVTLGAFVALAAGNDGVDATASPVLVRAAAIEGVMVVGGSVLDGSLWSASQYGANVEIAAPATEVPDTEKIYSTGYTYPYLQGEGTSFSTPMVASAAALAIAFAQTRGVKLTPAQVECFVKETARIEPKLGGNVQKNRHLSLDRLARQLNAQFPPR